MTTYQINFANLALETWTLCVYQKLPNSVGLDSVSWKQIKVPKGGTADVKWNIQYLACLADYKQYRDKAFYKAMQKIHTELGIQWKCDLVDGVHHLIQSGTTTAGQLSIINQSLKYVNLGIGMDGHLALVKRDVCRGYNVQFVVKPKYYVALFSDLLQGQVIDCNQILGPLEVVFEGGDTAKNYVARIEGSDFIFEEEGTQNRVSAPYPQIQERLKSLAVSPLT